MKWWLLSLLIIPQIANAKYLRIASEANLHLSEQQGQMFLVGDLTLENQGDEGAQEVFPRIRIDEWSTELSKQSLEKGEKFTWKVSQKISRSMLCLHVSKFCSVALPAAGDFMISLEKNYRDKNGYPFAVPEVLSLPYRKGDDANNAEWLRMELTTEQQSDTNYQVNYVIHDLTPKDIHVGLRYLLPKEVELLTSEFPVDVPANGELRGSFEIKNRSGLDGSDYGIILVAENKNEKYRQFSWTTARFKIQKYVPPRAHGFLWNWFSRIPIANIFGFLWIVSSLAAFLWVYLYWERPRGGKRGKFAE